MAHVKPEEPPLYWGTLYRFLVDVAKAVFSREVPFCTVKLTPALYSSRGMFVAALPNTVEKLAVWLFSVQTQAVNPDSSVPTGLGEPDAALGQLPVAQTGSATGAPPNVELPAT